MIMHLSIHHPNPEASGQLAEAMHSFERSVRTLPGVLSVHTLKDPHTGALISLTVWSTKDAWLSAQNTVTRVENNENYSAFESQPPVSYHLEEV